MLFIEKYLRYPYSHLPRDLILNLYKAELWKLCFHAICFVDSYRAKQGNKMLIKWLDLDKVIVAVIEAAIKSNYTLSISISEGNVNAIFPELLLRNTMNITKNEINLINMSCKVNYP